MRPGPGSGPSWRGPLLGGAGAPEAILEEGEVELVAEDPAGWKRVELAPACGRGPCGEASAPKEFDVFAVIPVPWGCPDS